MDDGDQHRHGEAVARMALDPLVDALRAAGEPTRLRALALLAQGELSVGELSSALGQSQPRVSRHLKLLTAGGLVERTPEAAWVFYRLASEGRPGRGVVNRLIALIDPQDGVYAQDQARLAEIRAAREAEAAAYFDSHAKDWDSVRALHQPEADVESAILAAAGAGPFDLVVDVGCGAGRMLELFAGRARALEGFDLSRPMLSVARAAATRIGPKAAVRLGDIYAPPLRAGAADLVVVHQVLHFLADPARAIRQAVDLLKPGGRLLLVDFATHDLQFLRERHAHRRLGFEDGEIGRWVAAAGADLAATQTLAPEDPGGERLTVKIWTCDRAAAGQKATAKHPTRTKREAA